MTQKKSVKRCAAHGGDAIIAAVLVGVKWTKRVMRRSERDESNQPYGVRGAAAVRPRPMAKVQRVGLFSRQVTESLSAAGTDALLRRATQLSEGQLTPEGHYFGSTMLTLDLARLTAIIQDPCDPATAQRLARHLASDTRVLEQVAALARREASALAQCGLPRLETEIRVRAEGSWVFIDIDVEADSAERLSVQAVS